MRLVEGVVDIDDVGEFVATLDDIGSDHGVTVQAFDARYIVSARHLERAVELADRAFDRGENVARDRGVEIMLYAAGRRQIDRALTLGVAPGEQAVVVLVAGTGDADESNEASAATEIERHLQVKPTLGRLDETEIRTFFDIEETECAAVEGDLEDLVLERVALLDVEK